MKQPGCPNQLSSDQVDEILNFIIATKKGHQMAYETVVVTFKLGVCLPSALAKHLRRGVTHTVLHFGSLLSLRKIEFYALHLLRSTVQRVLNGGQRFSGQMRHG